MRDGVIFEEPHSKSDCIWPNLPFKKRDGYRSGAALRKNDQKMIIFDFDTK